VATTHTQRDRLAMVLGRLDALPTLSPVAAKLLTLGSGDDVELDEIVSLIEADPTLTSKILGLCRRAGLGMSEQITTVRHAAVMLGLEAVRSAVLSVAVYELMEGEGERADAYADELMTRSTNAKLVSARFDREGFWRYAIGVATGAEMLTARHKNLGFKPEEAFVAGLLADLGKPMLDFALPRAYARIIESAGKSGLPTATVARELIGTDHHEASAHVGERWGLPNVLVSIMREHHKSGPCEGVPTALIGAVRVSTALCRELHIGYSAEGSAGQSAEALAEQHGLTVAAVASVRTQLHTAVSERCTLMGLDEQNGHAMLLGSIASANQHLIVVNGSLREKLNQSKQLADALSLLEWFLTNARGADVYQVAAAVSVTGLRGLGGNRWAVLHEVRSGDQDGWKWIEHDCEGVLVEIRSVCGTELSEAINDTEAGDWTLFELGARTLALCDSPIDVSRVRSGDAFIEAWRIACAALESMGGVAATGTIASLRAEAKSGTNTSHGSASTGRAETATARKEESAAVDDTESVLLSGVLNALDLAVDALREYGAALKSHVKDTSVLIAVQGVLDTGEALGGVMTGVMSVRDQREPRSGTHSLREIVNTAVSKAQAKSGWQGHVDVEGVDPGSFVSADRGMLESALFELVTNSMEASSGSDVLIAAHSAGAAGRWDIRVTDRGVGPPADAGERVFEPFFTSKGSDRHAGMGLTRARALMNAHGGGVKLERTGDGRTRVSMLFRELSATAGERGAAA
jgi:HD-like signal output (HDOD) protein/anti-sigma regulatory factor (Ser/Thr protein kinase)